MATKEVLRRANKKYFATTKGKQAHSRANKSWRIKNQQVAIALTKDHRAKKRKNVLKFLGNECRRCGFTDYRALQVDHIHGGGAKERKQLRTNALYTKILNGAKGYQLLCANCNWIKRYINNEVQK